MRGIHTRLIVQIVSVWVSDELAMGQHKHRKRDGFRGVRLGTGTADLNRHHVFVTLLQLPTLQGNGHPFVANHMTFMPQLCVYGIIICFFGTTEQIKLQLILINRLGRHRFSLLKDSYKVLC